jgi:uncharacterized protein
MPGRPLVLFHDKCADGFCSAWVARRALGEIEAVAAQYGQLPPDVAGRDVFILDFSYPRPVMETLAAACARLVVLDHHKTAAAELDGFAGPNVQVVFDMGKSGAWLTWEHFFPGRGAPWLVAYVDDRDLWKWELPFSRQVSAALASYPRDFGVWDSLGESPTRPPGLAEQGEAILRYQERQVEAHCRNAREVELDGHKVLAVNATSLMSEIGGKLAESRPFGATWFDRADGKRVWSLRSREGGVDVSEVARRRGGGGHFHAAGFEE